ncbi:uncharacterized protein LOC125459228 [Stegostoma tigrinum]|uniref:uncharacterized protein LOC125459228 n=1 Tax=Stegostoma tigrinum TaxID=3053191 RepID=UPI00202B4FEC|nr:uncharacterized protein LOC125459228 [Stegostoma tigrinum]
MLKEKGTDDSELDISSSIMEINKHFENTSAWKHIVGGDVKVDMYRSAKKCPHGLSNCLWSHSSDGIVYVPYILKSNFGMAGQFEKKDSNNLGTSYDYGSVMHFGKYYLAKSQQPTIVPKRNPNIPIGFAPGLSEIDVLKINKLYQCLHCAEMLTTSAGNYKGKIDYRGSDSSFEQSNCIWLIQAHWGHKILLRVTAHNLEESDQCAKAYLLIRDVAEGPPIFKAKICKTTPAFIVDGKALMVEFYHPGTPDRPGFTAQYAAVYSTVKFIYWKCGQKFLNVFIMVQHHQLTSVNKYHLFCCVSMSQQPHLSQHQSHFVKEQQALLEKLAPSVKREVELMFWINHDSSAELKSAI